MSNSSPLAPMRILHVVGRMDRAGAETMLMNYYNAIDRNRYQFDFLVFTDDRCDYDDEIEALGGRIVSISSSNWISRTFSMIRIFSGGDWICVHSHTNLSNMFSLFAACISRVPIRVSHAHVTEYLGNSFLKRTYHRIARAFIQKFATHKAACGKLAADLLYNAEDAVIIIPNAIQSDRFILDRGEVGQRVRRELGISAKVRVVLQVGRLDVVKNQMFTLEIAKKMRGIGEEFLILFVGRGALEETLRSEIEANDLGNFVKLLGVRSDVSELLQAADFFILPSLVEGFPVVLVEAQAAGTSCLVSDHVSSEVDLGLHSIKFLSIPTGVISDTCEIYAATWADALAERNKRSVSSEARRRSVLDAQGYSVTSAAERLTKIYETECR